MNRNNLLEEIKKLSFSLAFILIAILSACTTPKDIAYFQDRKPGETENVVIPNSVPFKLQPGDRISIYVKSRNEELTRQFNVSSNQMQGNIGSNGNMSGYLVDSNGEIDFPVLGKVKVAGYDREELTEYFTKQLRESKLVADAVVKIEYTGLFVTILGEGGGRRVNITKDRMTFFELLGEIGDLDINALRRNVLITREENGIRSQYEIDLTEAKNVYESPAYYVHQNDIVYIVPNDKTKRSSTNNGNMFHTWGFWTGAISLPLTLWSLLKAYGSLK